MIINDCFNVRNFILASVLVIGLGPVNHANAQSYLVDLNRRAATLLGTLGGGYSNANDINDSGQVAGESETATGDVHAFITAEGGMGMRDIGTLGGRSSAALGINDSGQVVGWSDTSTGARHAFITGADGRGMRDLGTMEGTSSSAADINNAGQAAGWFAGLAPDSVDSDTCCPPLPRYFMHAFITGPNGTNMRNLGADQGKSLYTEGTGINSSGQVTGERNSDPFVDGFITGENGVGIAVLNVPGYFVYARGINDAGQVSGSSDTAERRFAFITGPDGEGLEDLGTLGGLNSSADGINDAGQMVGSSDLTSGGWAAHAFITGPDGVGMTDLNSLIDMPDGFFLTSAQGINNAGQVIATAKVVPEPEIHAMLLAGLGLVGLMARRKKRVPKLG
jgi:probable HAF family extracellular repeat protein